MSLKILVPIALIAVGAGLYGLSGKLIHEPSESSAVVTSNDAPTPTINMVDIWVANQNLTKGQPISIDQFDRQALPESEFEKQSYLTEFKSGAVVATAITSGESLMSDHALLPSDSRYVEAIIADDHVPYAIEVDPSSIIGGLIDHGTLVDVIAISSGTQNLANDVVITNYQSVSVSPLFASVRVLKVDKQETQISNGKTAVTVNLILELTRSQLAKLSIARKISLIEVHKSFGEQVAHELQANSGDVLPDYRAIVEYRADKSAVK